MNRPTFFILPLAFLVATSISLGAQAPAPQQDAASPESSNTTLRINSRAVLVDVIVTDRDGNPVSGLKKEDFVLKEGGKRQDLAFFEEHRGLSAADVARIRRPVMPPDTFTNYTPIATPPAVNILLLDALNTPSTDQMYLHQSAQHYLQTLKPGTRLAIFTLGLRLRFVEGFSDDPVLLAKALGYRKNDRPDVPAVLPSLDESTAESTVVGLMNEQVGAGPGGTTSSGAAAMIQSFQQFMGETHYAQTADREYRTSQALRQLAIYLASVPGRKNLIWMTGAVPLNLVGMTDMRFDDTVKKTVNLLAASRVALFPVDVRGTWTYALHSAQNRMDQTVATPQQMIGPAVDFPPSTTDPSTINAGHEAITTASGNMSESLISEGSANNSSNASMEMLAQQTGGHAFFNGNDLGSIIDKVVSSSSNFYTLSYTPTNSKMDGGFRKIHVSLPGGKDYALSYRRGYFATDEGLPGASQVALEMAVKQAAQPGADPLKPFMDFGLPHNDQILFTERVVPTSAPASVPGSDKQKGHYKVDFVVNLNDLAIKLDPADGLHKGELNLSLIVYDRYGQISTRKDHRVVLEIKPDVWQVFEKTGLQLHDDVDVPSGDFWLRTGIYDDAAHKVGTMEVPLTEVHPMQASGVVPVPQRD